MLATDWRELAGHLSGALHLSASPVAITFTAELPSGVAAFDSPMAPPAPDGRTGRVAAGCVFWMLATDDAFVTLPEDHANCSVGSLTHGLVRLEAIVGQSDVAELLGCGWVTDEVVARIPVVSRRPGAIVYAPLARTPLAPDVVLLRVSGRQLMVLADALPGLRIEGKPQCHIVAIAKEQGEVAASVGCALSRARTGMQPEEMTCAIPGARLAEVVARVMDTAEVDREVARYAADDSRRFG